MAEVEDWRERFLAGAENALRSMRSHNFAACPTCDYPTLTRLVLPVPHVSRSIVAYVVLMPCMSPLPNA